MRVTMEYKEVTFAHCIEIDGSIRVTMEDKEVTFAYCIEIDGLRIEYKKH